ncbi:putative bifunctional diguanylate cyclase/phosphodiesterase [Nioella aestuarii]|uniref:putative bifunctional diguanylate cyclase/phosphodiesterase n=1 Tax=Nioella aestuarii TaxID=1662864 RepID=UPI003D7F838B
MSRIEVLAVFPALALLAFWMGAPEVIFATSFLLPGLLALQAMRPQGKGVGDGAPLDGKTGLPMRQSFLAVLDTTLSEAGLKGHSTACLVAEIDDFPDMAARWGGEASDHILRRTANRVLTTVRRGDVVACIGEGRFAITLHPVASVKLDIVMSLVDRLQRALSEPIAIAAASAHPTVSVGFATPAQTDFAGAEHLLDAALTALIEARRHGPGGVRGYSDRIKSCSQLRHGLAEEVEEALTNGDIRPWFQPQVCADTGAVTGFEALARWHHPEAGILTPADFLPAVADAGCMGRLGESILAQSLRAIQEWDMAGCSVPSVAVNFSAEELRDPTLADRLKWEVDRFDLRPKRLMVEILETVAAQSEDDVILRNIEQMGAHGFNLDLDDFGTGQSSIANIRRFRVNRIKIDRSFVTKLDQDSTQRAVVAGILALAERLNVSTVAEGVETPGERSVVAQLGCDHLQGYIIARPMPFSDTVSWMHTYTAGLAKTPRIGRRAG